jgi:DnaK suppressor protein
MLTKEQLFAMPEDDYMNKDQLAFFKALLTEQKDELDTSILAAKESLAHSEHNTDPNDVATQQEMQQIYLRTVERQGRLLNKITGSLRDIDSGEYGYCEVLGEPIGVRRLFARPTATMSIQAKEAQEHKEKTEGIF